MALLPPTRMGKVMFFYRCLSVNRGRGYSLVLSLVLSKVPSLVLPDGKGWFIPRQIGSTPSQVQNCIEGNPHLDTGGLTTPRVVRLLPLVWSILVKYLKSNLFLNKCKSISKNLIKYTETLIRDG